VNNSNSQPLTMTEVQGMGQPFAVGNGGCEPESFTFNPKSGLSKPLPPGPTDVVLSQAVSLSASANNACQSSSFTVQVRVKAQMQ
jgi:hypothetical protein